MRYFTFLVLASLLSAVSVPVPANGDDDHERARRALERGEILPLTGILDRASKEYPGHLIEAELDDEDGRMVYELVIITEEGRVYKLYYDASNGALLKVKGRNKRK